MDGSTALPRDDTFELHSVQVELEAVEKQIRQLLERQAELRAALESSRGVKPKPGATSSSGIRSAPIQGELPVPSTLDPKAAYADFKPDSLPLICTMNLSPDKPLLDSIFGKVQAGSILSYQHPPPTPDGVVTHKDAPQFPKVPLEGYQLKPTDCTDEAIGAFSRADQMRRVPPELKSNSVPWMCVILYLDCIQQWVNHEPCDQPMVGELGSFMD
ncbi:hypothetical protein Q8A67_022063 [Cirrhinus molitorella]|uniref:Uncharacterized protein n=1 Tax=Cirrhinus molitorella TaxID=172907 RepID=A0AA88P135_9TELE|nr:hypothetical protein Q8A67_022063 [Cirrhinus molitorella]